MEGFYHFSSLKQLVELGISASVLNLRETFISVINSLPNLISIKFIRHEIDSNLTNLIYFAENSNIANLQKFKTSIRLDSYVDSNTFYRVLGMILTKHIKLENLQLLV